MSVEIKQQTVEERLDELESRAAIAELVAAYCEGVDRPNLDRFMSLWHEDASYLIPGGRGDFHGIEGIRQSQEVISKAWKQTCHWTTNHVVGFETNNRAVGRSDAFAICEHKDGKVSFVSATYLDVYERRNGGWKFSERTVNRWFVSEGADIKLLPPF
jgi:ketosteroid isomerase-like protein